MILIVPFLIPAEQKGQADASEESIPSPWIISSANKVPFNAFVSVHCNHVHAKAKAAHGEGFERDSKRQILSLSTSALALRMKLCVRPSVTFSLLFFAG